MQGLPFGFTVFSESRYLTSRPARNLKIYAAIFPA
jgi:hypothetical protein